MTTTSDAPLLVEGFDEGALAALLGIPFSDEQLAAITMPLEPGVVVAGAGSGKTTVMTARVVWLVATGQVRPEQVLGLTFTTKAAGELAGRVRRAVRTLVDRAHGGLPAEEVGDPQVATYHAFAGRLIAEHGLRLGVEPGSRLLGDAAGHQLAQRVVARTARDLGPLGYQLASLVTQLRKLDGELAEHCLDPALVREFDLEQVARLDDLDRTTEPVRKMRSAALARIELCHLVDELRAAKSARDVIDFGDQLRIAAALAEQFSEVGVALREQYPVVLLDEYQDTSVSQRRLLVGLFGGGHPVTAVGDPLQAIYEWRGASVANIDRFPEHFARADGRPAAVLPLSENRRSGTRILTAANALAEPLRALHPQVRPLVSPGAAKGPGGVRVALLPTHAEEMAWLGDRVREQVDAGAAPGDIAVLCRVTSDFPPVLQALADRGLPVEVVGVDGMLALPEVAEVVAYLRVLHDASANVSLVRLLGGPRWAVGARDLALLGSRAAMLAGARSRVDGEAPLAEQLEAAVAGVDPTEVVSLADAVADPGEVSWGYEPAALERFAALDRELRALRRHVGEPLADLVHRVVTTTGLDVELSATPQLVALGRAEGLAAFVDLVAAFADAEGDASLGAFLAWLTAAQRYDVVPDLDRPPSPGAVQLMTVHKAKGLEWPVVVLPSLTDGVFPSAKGRDRWTSQPQVVPYPLRGDAESLPVLAEPSSAGLKAFTDDCRTHDEREERRLGYVAVTRAERLVLASGSWWGPSQVRPRGPSDYLTTLHEQCLAGAGTVDAWAPAPEDGGTNPALDARAEVQWPAVPDADALQRRLAAAEAVRGAGPVDVAAMRAETELAPSPLDGLSAAEVALVRSWDDDIELLLAELARDDAGTRTVVLPTSLSASDLVRLAADPEAYARRLARPVPSAPAAAARRGTRFHAWVEQHYGVRPLLEPDDLPGAADAGIDSDTELAQLRASFLTTPYAELAPVAVEVPFTVVLGGRVVPGRIDAVFAADGPGGRRYDVVDWKTGTGPSDPLQLAVYRVAWAELAGVPLADVDAAFVHVRDGRVERPPGLPDRAGLEALLAG